MFKADPTPATLSVDGLGERPEFGEAMARLGRYVVLGLLGRGGMGVVYSGFDEELRRRVAIKRINRRGVDEASRQRSLREAQALARLAHPNIVTVYEVLEVEGRLCIVMEFIAGRTLREWLAEAKPSRDEIVAALLQAGRGIAAAHAAGLVHRDLKPDNIMVGDDGRVRVMDFGLARAVDDRGEELEFSWPGSSPSLLLDPVTQTGAFIGTPEYAAPEQDLGITADAHSDIFSFCVLTFEALHGRRPFAGENRAEILEATLAGDVVAVPDGKVPGWLDAVIRRGLAVEPEARWPAMDALLAALADDPQVRSRRRRRALALSLLVVLLVVGMTYAASLLREAADRSRREVAAATRLDALAATLARTDAEGDPATAEAAFHAFVTDPAHRGTRALTRAWLARGDRRSSDSKAAKAAYAEAYVHAPTVDDEREALRRLSGAFLREWDGVGLRRSVELLRAHGADDLALAELGLRAALWQRDLGAAVRELERPEHPSAGWRPMLTHLARATASPLRVSGLQVLPGPGPARFAARAADAAGVVLLDAEFVEVGQWHDAHVDLLPGTSWVLAQTEREARVVDPVTGEVVGRGAPWIAPVASFDATGDGIPELFIGRAWPQYGFERWDGLGRPDMRARDAHPGTDASGSTFGAHAVGDLDGDGRDELAIGFGAWDRFDLRLYRPDARGELELLAARRLGRIGGLGMVRHGSRRLLAALVDDAVPSPEHFPDAPHTGGPPGVHLFEWRGGDLVEVDFVALPASDGFGPYEVRDHKAIGDLDGDGRDDLAFSLGQAGRPWLLLLRQTDAGFEAQLIADLRLFAGVQLDGDAPLELLVGRAPDAQLLALGIGDEQTPPLSGEPLEAPAAPEPLLADPWLVERWNRAGDLATLSLADTAAASLGDAALLVTDRRARSALLDRAGELFAGQGLMAEVLALQHDVHDDPRIAARAQARRALALSRLGRYQEALAEAESLLRGDAGDAASVRVATELAGDLPALLAPDAQIEVGFENPLAPQWQIHTPGAVRRNLSRSVLGLAIPAMSTAVAELPLDWQGGPVALEFALDVERLEFGASIEIAIAGPDGKVWLGAAFCGQGGGGALERSVWINAGSGWELISQDPVASAIGKQTIQARMTYFPERGYTDVMLTRDGVVWLSRSVVTTPPTPGPQRLLVGSFVDSTQSSLALGELGRLAVRGARLGAAPAEEVARYLPAVLLAEGEPRAALAALSQQEPKHPRGDALRLLAFAEVGDIAGVAEAAPDMLGHADEAAWRGDLALALRRHPLAAAALRNTAGPALLPALALVWSFARPHRNDPAVRNEILDGLQELERVSPATDAERDALRELLETRGKIWQHSGQMERGRRDSEAAAALARPPG